MLQDNCWTTDKDRTNYDYFRGDNAMVRDYGLQSPQPIMCITPESGEKYYLWNPIEGAILEIVTSMDLV
jgi:hypothetical protein